MSRDLLIAGIPELPERAFQREGGKNIKPQAGGGSSKTTNTTKVEPPPQLAPYLSPFMQQASAVAMRPYEAYGGQVVAGPSWDHNIAADRIRALTDQTIGDVNTSRGVMQQMAARQAGDYQPGNTGVGQNPLLGLNNPYLQSAIDANMGDVTRQFNNTILNNTDAAMARAGAFGGSAWQQAQQENARQMTESLGRVGNEMRMQDYALQAQLGESDLARQLQTQQFNASLNDQAYQNDLARQMQAAQMLPALNQLGFQAGGQQMALGDFNRAIEQGNLDAAYDQWLNQQNHPYQSLDVMANAIRTLMGSGGTTTATGPNPNRSNPFASTLGGAASGAAMGSVIPGVGNLAGGIIGGGMGLLGSLF